MGPMLRRCTAQSVTVAVATPPLGPLEDQFTNTPRYLRFEGEFGQVARESYVCAMHVHVEVADDAEGVRVIDGIRPWLLRSRGTSAIQAMSRSATIRRSSRRRAPIAALRLGLATR